jgi:hypothetical protein
MRVEESIIIDRSAEEVFAFISDRANDPVWMASVAGPMQLHTACIAQPAGNGCRATVLYEPERLPGRMVGRMTAPLDGQDRPPQLHG